MGTLSKPAHRRRILEYSTRWDSMQTQITHNMRQHHCIVTPLNKKRHHTPASSSSPAQQTQLPSSFTSSLSPASVVQNSLSRPLIEENPPKKTRLAMVYSRLRSLLSYSRLPLRIATMNPRPKVYRVRIRNAESRSSFWPWAGTFAIAITAKVMLSGDGGKDRTIFVPLSWTKEVAQPPYKRDDPIVQTYNSFYYDHDLQVEVQSEFPQSLSHLL